MVKHVPTMWETRAQSLGLEAPLEKEMAIHSSTLAGKSRGQRSLVVYNPWGRKESDTTEWLNFHFFKMFFYEIFIEITSTVIVINLTIVSFYLSPICSVLLKPNLTGRYIPASMGLTARVPIDPCIHETAGHSTEGHTIQRLRKRNLFFLSERMKWKLIKCSGP